MPEYRKPPARDGCLLSGGHSLSRSTGFHAGPKDLGLPTVDGCEMGPPFFFEGDGSSLKLTDIENLKTSCPQLLYLSNCACSGTNKQGNSCAIHKEKYCGWTKSISHRLENQERCVQRKYQQTLRFHSHSFRGTNPELRFAFRFLQ